MSPKVYWKYDIFLSLTTLRMHLLLSLNTLVLPSELVKWNYEIWVDGWENKLTCCYKVFNGCHTLMFRCCMRVFMMKWWRDWRRRTVRCLLETHWMVSCCRELLPHCNIFELTHSIGSKYVTLVCNIAVTQNPSISMSISSLKEKVFKSGYSGCLDISTSFPPDKL